MISNLLGVNTAFIIPINIQDKAINIRRTKITIPIQCTLKSWIKEDYKKFPTISNWWKSQKNMRIKYCLTSQKDQERIKTIMLIYGRMERFK